MFKLHVICVVLLFAILNWSNALPVKEQEVEDLIYKLQQLKQLNDVPQIAQTDQHRGGGEKERSHLAPDPNTPMKTKRSLNNSDRRTLLYNYYARGLAPMYEKRNFDEIDRYSTFGSKRNNDFTDQNGRMAPIKRNFDEIDRYASFGKRHNGFTDQNGRMAAVKRNFDEIDRYAGFNPRLRNDHNMKRNFDEIDRYGKFNKRLFREVEDLDAAPAANSYQQRGSSLADEMAVINEYSQ